MKWIQFNINWNAKVKLTNEGKKILAEYLGGKIPDWFIQSYNEGNGYFRFQLHELANIFGQELYNGNPHFPFETTIFLSCQEKPLKICPVCGNIFEPKPRQLYCSPKCASRKTSKDHYERHKKKKKQN